MSRDRLIKYCNKIIEISLYAVAFYIPISTALIEIFISLAIFVWLTKKIIARTNFKNIFYPTSLNLPILFYIITGFISAAFSTNQAISFRHLISKISEYLLLFFIVVEMLDRRILRNILIALVFSVTLVCIDGIYQCFTGFDFLRHRPKALLGRINGPFTTPNDFSNYIVTLLGLVASLSFLRFKKIWVKPLLMAIFLLVFLCLVFSATRSAWFALLSALPVIVALGNKKMFLYILLVIIVTLSLFPLLSPTVKFRITHFLYPEEAGHLFHRNFLWKIGLNMFRDRPIWGQGLGTFMYNFDKFKPQDYPHNWEISYAHNCFIQLASEAGILGFLSFILILAVFFFTSFKLLRKIKENHFYYYILSGLLVSIFIYLVSSFFDTNLYSLPLTVLFWFMMGLSVGITKIIRTELD